MSNIDQLRAAAQLLNQRKEPESSTLVGCAIMLALLFAMPFVALYHGWALWLLWNWFAVPLAPAITWHAAVGMMLLIGFLRIRIQAGAGKQKPQEALSHFLTIQLSILVFVVMGWAFHAVGFGGQP